MAKVRCLLAFDSWHQSLSPITFLPVEILSSACKCQYTLWLPFVAGLKVTSDALIGKSNWDALFQQPNFFSKYKYIIFPCLIVCLNLASHPPSLGLNDFHHLNVYLVLPIAIKNLCFVTVVCLIICSFHTTISELMVKRQYFCSISRCSKAAGFPQQHSQNWFLLSFAVNYRLSEHSITSYHVLSVGSCLNLLYFEVSFLS